MTALKITVLPRIIDADYDLLYVRRKFHFGQLVFHIPYSQDTINGVSSFTKLTVNSAC